MRKEVIEMENLKITKFLQSPMYTTITTEKLEQFFSTGYQKMLKERCAKNYTMFAYKQGILEANYLVKTDANRHTVDLMFFALAKIEELENNATNLKETVIELEKQLVQKETEQEKSKNNDKKGTEKNG